MKKVKKKDGSIVEVKEDYALLEGESFVEDLGAALETFGATIADNVNKKLGELNAQTKEEFAKVPELVKSMIQEEFKKQPMNAPDFMAKTVLDSRKEDFKIQNREKVKKGAFGAPYINTNIVNFESDSDDPINKFSMGVRALRLGDKRVAETYLHLPVEDYKKRMSDLLGSETYAQSIGTDADGGYLSPPEFELAVLMQLGKYGLFRRFIPVFPTGTKTQNLTALDSSVTAYWVNELAEITNSQFSLSRPTNNLDKLACLVTGSREFWEDATEVRNTLDALVAEEMDKKLDTQWIAGTGSPFTGLLSVTGGNDEVIGAGATVTGGVNLLYEDFVNAEGNLEDYNTDGAAWFMNKAILTEVRKIKDSTNRPLYEVLPSVAGNGPGSGQMMIGKYPVFTSSVMPGTTPGSSTAFAVLCNPQQVTRARARAGIIVEEFNQGTDQASVNLLTKDARSIRFIYRIGIFNFCKEDIDGLQTAVSRLVTAA